MPKKLTKKILWKQIGMTSGSMILGGGLIAKNPLAIGVGATTLAMSFDKSRKQLKKFLRGK